MMCKFCGGGMMIFPMIMMCLFIGLAIYLIKKHGSLGNAINAIFSRNSADHAINSNQPQALSGPMQILQERYAKGEITKEQFDQMKRDLE